MVLVIDDEDDIRDIVRTKLEAANFKVEDASNGPDGIKKATELIPDIILYILRKTPSVSSEME